MVLQNDIDLLNPPAELEKLKHKKKRLVQSPNSFFMVNESPFPVKSPPLRYHSQRCLFRLFRN
uniref:Uncharacterized protein n=1 Tax=Triticum urartu TaxID=4572 RepID=A0A8R7V6X3_TRIUA